MRGTCSHIHMLVLNNADRWEASLLADAIVPLLTNTELWEVRRRERRIEETAHATLTGLQHPNTLVEVTRACPQQAC